MIKGNGGAYRGCTTPMRDLSNLFDDTRFRNVELWENENVLDSTRRMRKILYAKDQKSDLSKIVSNIKHLNNNEKKYVT